MNRDIIRRIIQHEKVVFSGWKIYASTFAPPFPSKAFFRFIINLKKRVPLSTYIAVTSLCPNKCLHCSYRERVDGHMPIELLKRIIDELRIMGTSIIGFTGGEPTYYEHISHAIRFAGKDFMKILFTSGKGFNQEFAQKMKKSGLDVVVVSLDHHNEKIHDSIRNSKGIFQHACSAISLSREKGFYTVISSVAHRALIKEIFEFLKFAKTLGAHEVRILEPMPSGALLSDDFKLLTEKEKEFLRMVHKIANTSSEYPRVSSFPYVEGEDFLGCRAGYHHVFIGVNGDVFPCDFTPVSFGSLKEKSFRKIWDEMEKTFNKPRARCVMLEIWKDIMERGKKEVMHTEINIDPPEKTPCIHRYFSI